ncbi:hypothetical protein JWJ90_10925 [Desulfobulbus rhabdoformis]|jgi:hypothetical protein|uniref:hypothetical protein n=1 Tax=Desulfobulbus rhabdoformis TaxID=34032 RepID=UPI0019660C8D|nr:hypothetical protein [Desulfobulbus rhabdoformis]MBM9614797.1 hypothetical protein [Desulfobulbus rhabdoformis]
MHMLHYWQKTAVVLAFALITVPCGQPQQCQAKEPCEKLVQNKCSSCHFVTYICEPIERGKGSFYWKRTVKAMVMSGMETTKEENEQLVDCLGNPSDKVQALCPNK